MFPAPSSLIYFSRRGAQIIGCSTPKVIHFLCNIVNSFTCSDRR